MLNPGLTPQDAAVAQDVSMTQLPLHNVLPQWARVNTLDKARYPKPFLKDKLQPLESRKGMDGGEGDDDRQLDISGMNPTQRVHYLERSLHFLRQQHSDVLRALHSEVEELKKENKDLQHKVVMIQKTQQQQGSQFTSALSSGDTPSSRSRPTGGGKDDSAGEVKVMFLEEEIKELKHALRDSRSKSAILQQRLEQSEDACKRQHATLESMKQQMSQVGGDGGGGGGGAMGGGNSPPQSMSEYQSAIRQLQQVNERQNHELESLKSDLRDVLYSHKWTPDAYLLARAYVSEDDRKNNSRLSATTTGSKSALPKISVRDRGQLLSEVGVVQDSASLPALRQAVGNKAVERRKRVQLMQKDKLRRKAVPE